MRQAGGHPFPPCRPTFSVQRSPADLADLRLSNSRAPISRSTRVRRAIVPAERKTAGSGRRLNYPIERHFDFEDGPSLTVPRMLSEAAAI
jgi:hypothetical protein